MNKIQDKTVNGYSHIDSPITVEDWKAILKDEATPKNFISTLLCFYREKGHEATCASLSQKYSRSANAFSNPIWKFAEKLQKRFNFQVSCTDRDLNNWEVVMDGKESKDGFIWRVKEEISSALYDYLLDSMVSSYREYRKTHTIKNDDELYKWKLITNCKDKSLLDQANLWKSSNIVEQRMGFIPKVVTYLEESKTEEFKSILDNLVNEGESLDHRISVYHDAMTAAVGDRFGVKGNDERTASAALSCNMPDKYMFYMPKIFKGICRYLGIQQRGTLKNYSQYLDIIRDLAEKVTADANVMKLIAPDIEPYLKSDLLVAQDVVYTLFYRFDINEPMTQDKFEWIPFYEELAKKLLSYEDDSKKLVKLIYDNFDRNTQIKYLHDNGYDLPDIDPFTVFAISNRNNSERINIVLKMKDVFDLKSKAPTTFLGIPLQNRMNSMFIVFEKDQSKDGKDMERLWKTFKYSLTNPEKLSEVFDKVLGQLSMGIAKLTMGLFYIRPNYFLALDSKNRKYLKEYGLDADKVKDWASYSKLLADFKSKLGKEIKERTIPEFSANAYNGAEDDDDELINEDYYQEIINLLRFKKNVILEGAPGVGKTYNAVEVAVKLCSPKLAGKSRNAVEQEYRRLTEEGRISMVTFHQSMDYEEFVEGIKPETDDSGNISYKIVDGIFKQVCKRAATAASDGDDNATPYVLIIDEFNRGNVSKIFGELITLLEADKRAGEDSEAQVILPYSRNVFTMPANVFIIATMNTADRSIGTLDYAFRRRFGIVRMTPVQFDIDGFDNDSFRLVSNLFVSNFDEYVDNAGVEILPSEIISSDINPLDVWIGQSYFLMLDKDGNDQTYNRITYEIIPILEEYVQDGIFVDKEPVKEVMTKLKDKAAAAK